ncbi:uncharacterized protein LOC108676435, partial [Hyalella azteca]|uniref:Uncharacterized protein LOC108676435 n=1 Tax=Hyalella azteca TaxID=294128 RepID=A0A8B7P208_HYAAZ
LREVLLYVVVALSRDNPRLLTRRWSQLKEALRDARVTADDVMDCVARCPDLAGILVDLVGGEIWHVRHGRHVATVAEMLSSISCGVHVRPSRVVVDMKAADLRGAPWGELLEAAKGVEVELRLSSPDDYETHDDLVKKLRGSRVWLEEFSGCVGTSAGVAALASVASCAGLTIRMAAPLDLSALEEKYKNLVVYTRPLSPPGPPSSTEPPTSSPPWLCLEGADEGSLGTVAHTNDPLPPYDMRLSQDGMAAALASSAHRAGLDIWAKPQELGVFMRKFMQHYMNPTWPLPPSPPPVLVVDGADEGSWGAVAHTAISLAPPRKRFRELWLRDCRLREEELSRLQQKLRDEGVRTADEVDTRAGAGG